MKKQIQDFSLQVKKRSDKLMNYFLAGYFIIGLLLAFYFDTWMIAVGVGGLSLTAYYSAKLFLQGSDLYQYVLSAVVGIFMAQFIYQMHGMFEMHIFAFIGSALLITYQNWKLQIPLAVVLLLHHSAFGYLQFTGIDKVYFTQLEYMDIHTFIIHCLLSVSLFSICGLWAYNFKKSGELNINKSYEIGKLQEAYDQKLSLFAMSEDLRASNEHLKAANDELGKIFNTIEEVLFSVDLVECRLIQISTACIKVYGYTPVEFVVDNNLWKKLILPEDRHTIEGIDNKLAKGHTQLNKYRILHKDDSIRWIESKLIPTVNEQGKLVRIDGVHNDITARTVLENKLAESKKQKQHQITTAVITAQENERTFLGEELHDNINPILATARLYIECVISGEFKQEHLLENSKEFITTAMDEIRILSKSLIPPSLGEISLFETITEMIENIRRASKLNLIAKWPNRDESMLSDNIKLAIYRILQEQINNVLKHARAQTVIVWLEQSDDRLALHIKDDGIGFDSLEKRTGVGLQNIISRAELFNGTVEINTEPGNGCEIIVNLDMHSEFAAKRMSIRA